MKDSIDLITRKEISAMFKHKLVSVKMVERNEAAWELDKCRTRINARVAYYRRDCVLKTFKRLGFL